MSRANAVGLPWESSTNSGIGFSDGTVPSSEPGLGRPPTPRSLWQVTQFNANSWRPFSGSPWIEAAGPLAVMSAPGTGANRVSDDGASGLGRGGPSATTMLACPTTAASARTMGVYRSQWCGDRGLNMRSLLGFERPVFPCTSLDLGLPRWYRPGPRLPSHTCPILDSGVSGRRSPLFEGWRTQRVYHTIALIGQPH